MLKYIKVLGSDDRRVVLLLETHVSGRKIDRRVLATDIDAELGLAQRFNLIPISGVGDVSEAVGGEGGRRNIQQ